SDVPLFYYFSFHALSPTEIYTLSLHDALPISNWIASGREDDVPLILIVLSLASKSTSRRNTWSLVRLPSSSMIAGQMRCSLNRRSEEHTSELQSLRHLVCRLLLEKKKYFKVIC